MLRRLLVPLAVIGLVAADLPAAAGVPHEPPAPIALDGAEVDLLARRKVVVRPEIEGAAEAAGGATGIVDVAAAPGATLDAILDLTARVGEITGLRAVSVYESTPASIGARWELRLLATAAVFHVRYQVDRPRGWVWYGLDTARAPNDLAALEGAYQVYPVAGGSRIVYRAVTDSGRPVPKWLARWIATESLAQQLEGIRARAEGR